MGLITSDSAASGDEPMAAINVTSLVDVMFCLLIMFMVATPLMSKDEVEIALPKAQGHEMTPEELEMKMVTVDGTGRVFVGVLPLDAEPDKWRGQLAANPSFKESGVAFLQGDETVPYSTIVDVLVALRQAGVNEVGFVTDPRIGVKKAKGATP